MSSKYDNTVSRLKQWVKTDINLDDQFLRAPIFAKGSDGHEIMHDWETPIMEADAERLCAGGGSILNIGYGMGIIDGFIKSHKPDKHTIIEIHPQIVENARAAGYENVLQGDWLNVVQFLDETFDAIYFDTYSFDRKDWAIFTKYHVNRLLKPGGRYSYFNRSAAKLQGVADMCRDMGWTSDILPVEFEEPGLGLQVYESIVWTK